jgi:predicted amidohydrolase YtcJ
VLSEDLLTAPAKAIQSAKVLMTIVGGRIVFTQPEAGASEERVGLRR